VSGRRLLDQARVNAPHLTAENVKLDGLTDNDLRKIAAGEMRWTGGAWQTVDVEAQS
jgi:hypothetical protein